MEMAVSVTAEISLSGQRSRYRTASRPRKIASGTETIAAQKARNRVLPSRLLTFSAMS